MGLELAGVSAHKPTDSEFTSAILRLRNAGCDLVLMGTVVRDTILVLEAARKMGWKNVAWVGNNAAFTCPRCGTVFLVSAMPTIHAGSRPCPTCEKSVGHCTGGRKDKGRAFIEW